MEVDASAKKEGSNTIQLKKYNELKRRLKTAKLFNGFQKSSENLWRTKCDLVKMKLNKAIGEAECTQRNTSIKDTPLILASRNDVTLVRGARHSEEKDHSKIKSGLLEMEVRVQN